MQELPYFLICLAATTLGAISGIGGGVIIKPVLDALSPLGVSSISFLSACTVWVMAVVSMVTERGCGAKLDSRCGTLLALGSVLGGILGKAAFGYVRQWIGNDTAVGMWQNILMLALTALVFAYYVYKHRLKSLNCQSLVLCTAVGLSLGLISAFLGIGGGPINLMVLSYLFSMDAKTAALHSLYIILFSQTASLITTFAGGSVPPFSPVVLVLMALGGVLGAMLGRSLNRRMSNRGVERFFQGVLVMILCICVYNILRFMSL